MKKLSILSIACLAISFASCKKDYTCTCSTSGQSVHKIIGVSKKTAKANCVSRSYNGIAQTCALSK
ncbi:MAG: hypothetical protein V4677_08195 [Bacteroidota bacterium]